MVNQRLPLVPTLLFILLLIGLGTWQLQRLQWKEALLAEIHAAQSAKPVDLNAEPTRNLTIANYQHVKVRGFFDHARELHMTSRVHDGQVGYHIVTPLRADTGITYLINRGWVPVDKEAPATRSSTQPEGEVTLTGIARLPAAASRWQPANDVPHNRWYGYDLGLMYQVIGVSLTPPAFYIEADGNGTANLPIGGVTQLDIPNNHLQYAFTWYGLAAMIGLIFVINRIKRSS